MNVKQDNKQGGSNTSSSRNMDQELPSERATYEIDDLDDAPTGQVVLAMQPNKPDRQRDSDENERIHVE